MNFPVSQKGFSLVEALLVLAISSIAGLAVLQTMRDSANSMAFSEAKFEEQELAREVQSNLVYKLACQNNLVGKVLGNVTATDIEQVVNTGSHVVFKKGQTVGHQSLKIKDFEFVISDAALAELNAFKAAADPSVPFYMLEANFVITTEKLKTTLGAKESVRSIPLRVKVDATSTITECFATTDAANYTAMTNFCVQMGGTYNSNTNLCEFNNLNCSTIADAKLIPAKCVDEKIDVAIKKVMADIAATRVPAAEPSPSPTPPADDPFKLPFSYTNPGPGCTGSSCAASDFGPCNGTFCTTNGGSCVGIGCKTGVTTGTVAYDGTNMFTPSKPGPGCSGSSCHANDYGPCKGTFCTTNGGSCDGIGCRTGITN